MFKVRKNNITHFTCFLTVSYTFFKKTNYSAVTHQVFFHVDLLQYYANLVCK